MRKFSLRYVHTFLLLGLLAEPASSQTIFSLDPPLRLNSEKTISKVKISRGVNERDTVIFLEDRSTLVVDFTTGLYFLYNQRSPLVSGRAEPVGTSFVGSETPLYPLLARDMIFRLSRPVEIPLHWGKKITFDAMEMLGGPYTGVKEQSLRLGNVRNGIFAPLEDFQQVNSRGNTMFFTGEILNLAAYIAEGENCQGVFISLRQPNGVAYAKVVSVPYSGGPGDFPPTEVLARSTSHFILESDPREDVFQTRNCSILAR